MYSESTLQFNGNNAMVDVKVNMKVKVKVKVENNLEMGKRSTDSDSALQCDGDGRVDRAHHGHVDQAKQEGDQVREEDSLKYHNFYVLGLGLDHHSS